MKRLSEYWVPFKYDTSYAYSVGRIRALETRLLTRQDFVRILAAEDIEALFRILAETDYGQTVTSGHDLERFEEMLGVYLKASLDLIEHLSKDPEVTDLLKIRYDYHNVKVLLKAKVSSRNFDEALLHLGLVEPAELAKAFEGETPSDIPRHLRRAIESAEAFLTKGLDPQGLDVIVDNEMFSHLLSVLKRSKVPFLWGWVEREIDLANIKTFFRLRGTQQRPELFRQSLAEGGSLGIVFYRAIMEEPMETVSQRFGPTRYGRLVEEGASYLQAESSFARLERRCDGFLISYLGRANYTPFGVEPLVAYALMKEFEIKAVRAVTVGKWNGVAKESIRERLPDVYV